MKYKKLSLQNMLMGKIGNILNLFKKSKKEIPDLIDYQLVEDLTPKYSLGVKQKTTGIYEDKKGQEVVIKKVLYEVEDSESIYLRNEAFILKTLKEAKTGNKIFPDLIEYIDKPNLVAFVIKFFDGKGLDTMDKKTRIREILKAFDQVKELSETLRKDNFKALPVRQPFYYLLSFASNLMRLILKNPLKTLRYIKYAGIFYKNYYPVLFGKYTPGFVHRDIYPDNILYSPEDQRLLIIDWESAVISDSLYDLSQLAMIYTKDIGIPGILNVLKTNLKDNSETKRFIGLSIFNSIQILTNNKLEHPVFKETENFLDVLLKDICPKILYKKSPFERINSITLDAISLFYKITGLPKYSTNKTIILCYHSVGNTGWRYSVRTDDFNSQLDFLKTNYNLVSLQKLLGGKEGGVHITFDDGYKDVLENAYPVLRNVDISPTIFVLGNLEKANRMELDNNMPLLSFEEIEFLHNNGWEIGYHSATHADLSKMNDLDLEQEIIRGKIELENKIGFPIRYFAYPKGKRTEKTINYVKKAKYAAAFTTDGYEIKLNQDKAWLSRVSIEKNLGLSQLEALLSPIGLFVSGIFTKILVFKAKYISKD